MESAQFTYYLLFFASTVSFIAGFFYKKYKTILWIESTITCIASFIYYYYLTFVKNELKVLNNLRYIDWSLTTPLMLISLSLILSLLTKIPFSMPLTITVILLDLFMLSFGYAGEIGWMTKQIADVCGFIPFIALFALLYKKYKPKGTAGFLFFTYLLVWSGYGVVYLLDETNMNIGYNILDSISKAMISLFISGFILIN